MGLIRGCGSDKGVAGLIRCYGSDKGVVGLMRELWV